MRTHGWTPTRRHSAIVVLAAAALAAGLEGAPASTGTGTLASALTAPTKPSRTQSARPKVVGASPTSPPSPSAERPDPRETSTSPSHLLGITADPHESSAKSHVPTSDDEKPDDGTGRPGTENDDRSGNEPAWAPPAPLPSASADSRRVTVVLTPHPDDETLSLGAWTANAVAQGQRVIIVAVTDGRGTGAIKSLSTKLGRGVTRNEIADARIRELISASIALGIDPGDIYLAHCDAERSAGGARITPPEATAIVETFAERFPLATFATMSWVAERHTDHLVVGQALRDASETGVVKKSVFAISRLWWKLPSPKPVTDVRATSATARRRVLAAAASYQVWNPARKRYSVGWLSVRHQFTSLIADPRSRVHQGPKPTLSGMEP
ncbi:MAG: hypothetical protein QG622_348 [Actinomycetota bacterium]|nr:hypothetical protein [Actinomycetota bacterium]